LSFIALFLTGVLDDSGNTLISLFESGCADLSISSKRQIITDDTRKTTQQKQMLNLGAMSFQQNNKRFSEAGVIFPKRGKSPAGTKSARGDFCHTKQIGNRSDITHQNSQEYTLPYLIKRKSVHHSMFDQKRLVKDKSVAMTPAAF
jgi:hypothetical protein